MKRASRPVSLTLVLACLMGTLVLGAIAKSPCASGRWSGQQYRQLCYSDIVPLFSTEELTGGRLPFLQQCVQTQYQCDEYPVLTMYFMRVAAWISGNHTTLFFATNAVLLAICAVAVAVCLYMMGASVLRFVLAPTLLIYGFMNWDLLAVAFATGGLLAFARRRDALAGALLGLGAAAKFYPAMLAVPLIAERIHRREPDRAITVGWSMVASWALVNLTFAITAPSSWFEFFRFNSTRPADWDSVWYIGCQHVHLAAVCDRTARIDLLSLVLFAATFALLWWLKDRRDPGFPRWLLGFPLLVAFLAWNKVYSPQYGLWLLPWFAFDVVSLPAFIAFEVADVMVFVTRFSFFGRLSGVGGLPFGAFEVSIAVRMGVLVWCVVQWMRRWASEPEPAAGQPTTPAGADAAEATAA